MGGSNGEALSAAMRMATFDRPVPFDAEATPQP